jgi:ribonucleoside-diphosphate reductase subunit M2
MSALIELLNSTPSDNTCLYKLYEDYDYSIRSSAGAGEQYGDTEMLFSFDVPVDNNVAPIQDMSYMEPYHKYIDDFNSADIINEPILSEENNRYTIFPIKYATIWENYLLQKKAHWTVDEIDFSKDLHDWENKLSNSDRIFILHVLAFFASADGLVNANIKSNLIDTIKIKEAECAYGRQFDMENVHGHIYSLMIDNLVKDPIIKDKLFNSITHMPSIKQKSEWCEKWINSDKTYAHKLVAFSVVEGVYFSGSFASIFWLKTRPGKVMKGLRSSNRFIARDEALHVDLAVRLYHLLKNKLRAAVVYQIVDEALLIEIEFINSSLPCKLLGMNADLMTQYIKYVADALIVRLGYPKLYNTTNPFEYMDKIDAYVKSNFFEERTDSYSDSKVDNDRTFVIQPWALSNNPTGDTN